GRAGLRGHRRRAAGHQPGPAAVHAAHRLAGAYPGGQLFATLAGALPVPAEPDEVLARFLRALGSLGGRCPIPGYGPALAVPAVTAPVLSRTTLAATASKIFRVAPDFTRRLLVFIDAPR